MNILYDHQIFTTQIFGGISRYYYELIKYFMETKTVNVALPFLFTNNYYLNNDIIFSHKKKFLTNTNFKGKVSFQLLINEYFSKNKIIEGHFDIFHPTYYDTYFLENLKNKPFVLTIYDMIEEKYFKSFKGDVAQNKYELAKRATKLISISENTKRDIIELYGINHKKIDVIYLASSISKSNQILNFNEIKNYILFVGKRGSYKNFHLLLRAYHNIKKEIDEGINILCIGGGKFNREEKQILKELGILANVFQMDVLDSQLFNYYKNALFFIFPSLYEGFGLPILEAFSCDCPVACSNTSSFPEVAGDAALYFDPTNLDSIARVMHLLLTNNKLKLELISKGRIRLLNFSWAETARCTKKLYEGIF